MTMARIILASMVLFLGGGFFPARAGTAEGWAAVATRPGVQVDCLISQEQGAQPTRILLLFPGGFGTVGPGALAKPTANFLVRSRALFLAKDLATVVVNVPSDQPGGMSDGFRVSPEHAVDIGCVIDFLKARFPAAADFYLVGTSRGTISAAYAGRRLEGRLKGIILSSEVLNGGSSLAGASVPILLVHHRNDGCKSSPYRDALALSRELKLPLITVEGGRAPATGPCEPGSPHGYWGKEAETVAEILHWVRGEPFRERI